MENTPRRDMIAVPLIILSKCVRYPFADNEHEVKDRCTRYTYQWEREDAIARLLL